MKKLLPALALWALSTTVSSPAGAQQSSRKVAPGQRDPALITLPVAPRVPAYVGPALAARPAAAWTTVAPLATARGQHAAVAVGGKIYAWAGYTSPADGGSPIVPFNSLEVYTPATNTWSAGANYPITIRGNAAALGADGLIYSFSGYSDNSGGYLGNSYRYTPATNTWTAIASVLTAVWLPSAATGNNGLIYVIGGSASGGITTSTQVYNPTTNTWTSGAAMPTARLGAVAVKDANGLIHVMGGNNSFNDVALATHEVYNPTTNTWTSGASLPTAVFQAGATLGSDGLIYVTGGRTTFYNNSTFGNQNLVQVYNPATSTWSTGTALPSAVAELKTVAVGNQLYAIGGSNGTIQSAVYQSTVTAAVTATSWTGAVSTDWATASNWSNGVPTSALDATIPAGQPRYPVLTTGTYSAKALTLASGASLTQSGGTLDLAGNFSNAGTFSATGGLVTLTGSGSQALGGSSRTTFWNLNVGPNAATLAGTTDVQRLLTLTGNLNTSSQPFTLLSSASGTAMVYNNGGAVVGATTVQRYLDPSLNAGLGYRHYSSPVQATTVADLGTAGFTPVVNSDYNSQGPSVNPFPTVYGYDESRINATNATTLAFEQGYFSPGSLGDGLTPGRGYTVNIGAGEKVDLVGTLNNGPVAVGTLSRGGQPNSGWQLLGNPYPSPLDWNLARTALPTGVQDAIYVYKSSDQYNGTYQSYVNGFGTLPGGLVPSLQGFFLRVSQTVPVFSFQNTWRSTTYQNPTFNRSTADLRPSVQLDLVSAQGTHEPTFVYFEQGATAGFDAHYDAEKLPNTTGLNLSSEAAGQRLAINGLAPQTAATVVPLAVGVPVTGVYTLQAAALANLGTTSVYLHDAVTGQQIDLKQQPSYHFTASSAALITGRFTLYLGALTPTASKSGLTAGSVSLYPNPAHGQVTVGLPAVAGATQAELTLLTVLGQVVRTARVALPASGAQTTVDVQGLPQGVYLLRVQAGPASLTKRLIVR